MFLRHSSSVCGAAFNPSPLLSLPSSSASGHIKWLETEDWPYSSPFAPSVKMRTLLVRKREGLENKRACRVSASSSSIFCETALTCSFTLWQRGKTTLHGYLQRRWIWLFPSRFMGLVLKNRVAVSNKLHLEIH